MPRQTKRCPTLLDSADLKMTSLSQYTESDENLPASHKIVYTYEKQIKKDKNFWSNVDSLSANKLKIDETHNAAKEKHLFIDESEKHESNENLDSIKSGESVFKLFTFESQKHTSNIEKCVAFWKTILSRNDIKPVDCTLKPESSHQSISKISDKSNLTESSRSSASEGFSWYDILLQLQTRNLDKVAAAATFKRCTFCANYPSSYSDDKDSTDANNEDIIKLNYWTPKKRTVPQVTERNRTVKEPTATEVLKAKCDTCKCKFDAAKGAPEQIPSTENKDHVPIQNKPLTEKKPLAETSEKESSNLITKTEKHEQVIDVSLTQKPTLVDKEKDTQQSNVPKLVTYHCDCGHSDCLCNIDKTENKQESSNTKTEQNNMQSEDSSSSSCINDVIITEGTQCPECMETSKEKIGKYCVICGLKKCRCEAVEPTESIDSTDFAKVAEDIINFALDDSKTTLISQTNDNDTRETNITKYIEYLHEQYNQMQKTQESDSIDEIKKCTAEMKIKPFRKIEEMKELDATDVIPLELKALEQKYYMTNSLDKKVCYNNTKIYHPVKKPEEEREPDRGPGRKL